MTNKTKFTRKELTAKANGWITANADKWAEIKATKANPYQYLGKIIERMYGTPWWRDRPGRNKITGTMPTPDDPGVRFFVEDAGKGKVKFMSVPTRRATRGGPTKTSSGNRAFTERITSPPDTDFVDSNRRMGEANSRNMDGGHINDLERQRAGQDEAVRRGRTVQQYQKTFLDAGEPIGHTRGNIIDQTAIENRVIKPAQLKELDSHLDNLTDLTYRGGVARFPFRPIGLGLGALSVLSDVDSVQAAVTTPRTDDIAQTERDLSGLSGVTGLASLVPALAPIAVPMSVGFSGASAAVNWRQQRDQVKERTQAIMDPDYRVQVVEGELNDTQQLQKERGYDIITTM